MSGGPRILVAALNWGLGHAARCLPLVDALRARGATVLLASDGAAADLWRAERPALPLFELPPYRITYRHTSLVRSLLPQVPHLVRTVRAEHRRLDELIATQGIDAVISDNRYGCYARRVPSVFVTHQLRLRMPRPWPAAPANRVNHALVRRFDRCWVPDFPQAPGLAGALAHGPHLPPAHYLGPLSRLRAVASERPRYRQLALLSGPEPQRTYLEQEIIRQAATLPGPTLIVGGLPGGPTPPDLPGHIAYRPFLKTRELERALAAAELVVCRSGYSTLMDLAKLGKRALLVPTPGQTEQEYLAQQLAANGQAATQTQADLDLAAGLAAARASGGLQQAAVDPQWLQTALDELYRLIAAR